MAIPINLSIVLELREGTAFAGERGRRREIQSIYTMPVFEYRLYSVIISVSTHTRHTNMLIHLHTMTLRPSTLTNTEYRLLSSSYHIILLPPLWQGSLLRRAVHGRSTISCHGSCVRIRRYAGLDWTTDCSITTPSQSLIHTSLHSNTPHCIILPQLPQRHPA